MAVGTRPTGKQIIETIVEEMRLNLFPLLYSTLAPSVYHVYLSPEDYERIEGIIPRIIAQAQRALDEEVQRRNRRPPMLETFARFVATEPIIELPVSGWSVLIAPDRDGELQPGQIGVISKLMLPATDEFGTGTPTTKVIKSVVRGATRTVTSRFEPTAAADAAPHAPSGGEPAPRPADSRRPQVYARLRYADERGPQTYVIDKDRVLIGRGGTDHWVDVELATSTRVSREHARIRRDGHGRFFIKDLSQWGTTVNGDRVPPGAVTSEGHRHELDAELALPTRARIELGGVVVLEFEAEPSP
ncbi:MAG: FHA domain-containing protein [Vicinamibacterales bacterium]